MCCGIIASIILLICSIAVHADNPKTFTIHADRMTFTNRSGVFDLLEGVIKAENTRAESVTIFNGGVTIKVQLIESPFITLEVTRVTIIKEGVKHAVDLSKLLLGEEVTWEDVTLEVKWLETSAIRYKQMEITP